jgi:hypothetical protein
MAASTPRKKQTVKTLIRTAKRAVRTVRICTRADLVDEAETLEAQLEKAKEENTSIGGSPQLPHLAERLAELRQLMDDATIVFRIRALPQRKLTEVIAQHPPREGNPRDKVLGFHVDDVIEQLIRQGTEEPALDDDDWQILLEETLNAATYAQLTNAAWNVNDKDVSAPFSPAG